MKCILLIFIQLIIFKLRNEICVITIVMLAIIIIFHNNDYYNIQLFLIIFKP